MCGRYRLTAKERYLRDHFGLEEDPSWGPRYNLAPTQQVPTIRQSAGEPRRYFSQMRWGLIPRWARDAGIGLKTINAMSETAAEKPAFRDSMRWRRCLVPADSFYEWKVIGPRQKQPYCFTMADDSAFAFAGLWDSWRDQKTDTTLESCTVLTTVANALVAEVHDRMPVVLLPKDYAIWLDPRITEPKIVAQYLKPLDAELMKCYPVSTRINCTDNDDPECGREIQEPPVSGSLF